MKVAVMTICYNEEETLGAVLKNWKGRVDKHVVLHSDKPWHGRELPEDRSGALCIEHGAEFIRLPWKSETEQRNWGLGYLYQYDYVLIVDADELYTEADQLKILTSLGTSPDEHNDHFDCYRIAHVRTYFKTPEYVLDPPDTHKPLIAIRPKRRIFSEHRAPSTDYQIPIDVTMHHLSYLRSDARMYHKIRQFEHHDAVRKDWFAETWLKWKPGMDDEVRAHGPELSRAIPGAMPQEIRALLAP